MSVCYPKSGIFAIILLSGIMTAQASSAATVCDVPAAGGNAAQLFSYATPTTAQSAVVCNPLTGATTTVTGRTLDPAGVPTAGQNSWVETADGYHFMVKSVGDKVYADSSTTTVLEVASTTYPSATSNTVGIKNTTTNVTTNVNASQTAAQWAAYTSVTIDPPVITPASTADAASGFRDVRTGSGGSNGGDGAFGFSAGSGGTGGTGPTNLSGSAIVNGTYNATANVGVEVASIGGNGGAGGDGYLGSGGASGGDGGKGGTVNLNYTGAGITTSGTNNHGIFALSRSGKGGSGGSGFLSFGAGSGGGGAGSDGGSVTVTTGSGTILTNGNASHGIYGLSVGNNGGSGGGSFGFVGNGGSGGTGGKGGSVSLTNGGSVQTKGIGSHGILSQSIGGGGGDAGTSGGIVAFSGVGNAGGSAGSATASNTGTIRTDGNFSRGMFVQSIGGGGGSGGGAGGLFAIGGAGAGGGTAGNATATNSGTIFTKGIGSDGIMVQSIAGSGGAGGNTFGLVSIGGSGDKGGDGKTVSVTNSGSITTEGFGARGIIAQSIGGGGGDGGSSAGMVAVGGGGAGGGKGGAVNIVNTGSILTKNDNATGIFGQSVGGGGGNGGSSSAVGIGVAVAIGGTGGGGGAGGVVTADLGSVGGSQRVTTEGRDSKGIFLQSVGGGGGNGGGAVAASVGPGISASIAVGGTGGNGGAGGAVTATSSAANALEIYTKGSNSTGAFMQSVGGGGGNGGYAVSAALSVNPFASLSVALSFGGAGGKGGDGGTVSIGQTSALKLDIVTEGDFSGGGVFQSVGGGGGNGGTSVSAAASAAGGLSGAVSVAMGGSGGEGGDGGTVRMTTEYQASTRGANAAGLLLQSVGGGGGNGGGTVAGSLSAGGGGSIGASVGLGGSGGEGGIGGSVTLNATGNIIETAGSDSTGVIVQSIGGGGGNGGFAITPTASLGGGISVSASVALGGKGGGGGAGGTVSATVGNDVKTGGNNSIGILAQSVGGGGGNGGLTVAPSLSAGGASAALAFSMGGKGGPGTEGGTVSLTTSDNTVTTGGSNATGIIAQSIGGGGGNGGVSVAVSASAGALALGGSGAIGGDGGSSGKGGNVTVDLASTVNTTGANSGGILVQSVGGGGGNGGTTVAGALSASAGGGSLTGAVGGKGGSGNAAGIVTGSIVADVATTGASSTGITVQSIGGGGGNGGTAVSASLAGAGIAAGAAGFSIGGEGGSSGLGGTVTMAQIKGDTLSTTGGNSTGVLVQSVGGGGGNGGMSIAVSAAGAGKAAGALSAAIGGNAGSGNHGGAVTVNNLQFGTLTTDGASAMGLVVQSLGGGGGNGGMSISGGGAGAGVAAGAASASIGGKGAGGGKGGIVTAGVTSTVIMTQGANSTGILAQSVGGGGGNGGLALTASAGGAGVVGGAAGVSIGGGGASGNTGGGVNLTGSAITVVTKGAGADGIVAQSIGGGGGNGGGSIAGSGSGAGTVAGSASAAIGGAGGSGSDGGTVNANLSGTNVATEGNDSIGLMAQSVGGGGGNGGFSIAGSGSGAGTVSGAASVGIGGKGGAGGFGGTVNADFAGTSLSTLGNDSTGILAQSVGGGGGNGGFTITGGVAGAGTVAGSAAVSIGGAGGTGSQGGTVVSAADYARIDTFGRGANGIVAQSLGGGGGNGGFSITGSGSGAGTVSGAASIGLGGGGGGGGFGGAVTANIGSTARATDMLVITRGDQAMGILAQSIGGGGGNGGMVIGGAGSGAGTAAGAVGVSIGGSGGTGNTGGAVVMTTDNASVQTVGDSSIGILAQSLGGGGGNGGMSIVGGAAGAGTGAGAVSVALGGSGGSSSSGGSVTATLEGDYVVTGGTNATAIMAQSVGGGGGNGGLTIAGSGAGAGTGAAGVSVAIGGSAGDGSEGGQVTLSADYAMVSTTGDNSSGIVGQSIGGGGGNGGIAISANGSAAGTGAGGVAFGLGGSGGTGGIGGAVSVTADGDIVQTTGANAYGVLSQSIGGGGGNGGMSIAATASGAGKGAIGVSVGIGGSGGTGGHGGAASLTSDYVNVTTTGENAVGLASQSIGGGGGNGGMSVAATLTGGGTGAGAISVGIGGSGGSAGDGSTATTVLTQGAINTTGNDSLGILTQSVGGGGGNGGMAVAVSVAGAGKGAIVAALGLGGSAGGGGDAGAVSATGALDYVATRGENASGIVTQSLGGGGGNGGMSITATIAGAGKGSVAAGVGIGGSGGGGGDAGAVTVDLDLASAQTLGAGSHGVLSQSLGGGGGNGGMAISANLNASKNGAAVSVGIGGSGGDGGNGGRVTQTLDGTALAGLNIATQDDGSFGVLAQSVGGGGGNGGMAIAGAVSLSQSNGGAAAIGIGGFGGKGGFSGDVSNTMTATVTTLGDNSVGIATQSIGGGGGNGATSIAGAVSLSGKNGGAIGVGIGGFGGDGGDAGTATSVQIGNVATVGENSTGVLTQSLGGGGGNGGTSIVGALSLAREKGGSAAIGVGGFGGDGGDSAAVSATVTGDVTTQGDAARGVLAQSIGGGGGNGGTNVSGAVSLSGKDGGAISIGVGGFGGAGGDAGTVALTTTGDVMTQGDGATGLMAQSLGGGGGNGGTNVSGSLTITNPKAPSGTKVASIAIGVGGFGGGAGDGKDVTLQYGGTLQAVPLDDTNMADLDQSSTGIIAQSIGGGGGNGGTNVSAGLTIASRPGADTATRPKGYAVVVGVGGFGGAGGNAGDVDVTLDAGTTITALGVDASGVAASSIGGGGGNGGLNVSGGITSDASIVVGIGGFGGTGGTAGDVVVTAQADITVVGRTPFDAEEAAKDEDDAETLGDQVLERLGDAGKNVIDVLADDEDFYDKLVEAGAVGDDDKNAADMSAGIFAQSIGGGGGNGGMNVSGGMQLSKDGNVPSITFGIGGSGGAGAISGNADVTQTGSISVVGHNKSGIIAQSIAGGGGNGATNISGNMAWGSSEASNGKTDLAIVAGIGGFAGSGADAGDATVTSLGGITTHGDAGHGIFAQSVGGGGGNGGMNITGVAAKDSNALALGVGGYGSGGGHAGAASVTHGADDQIATIQTDGERAHGIFAQSIGGGGGNGGANMILGYSGDAGSADAETGGDLLEGMSSALLGDTVTDGFKDLYETYADAKSAADVLADKEDDDADDTGDDKPKKYAFAGQVAIGGAGGEAGNGSTATVVHTGDIVTLGDNSHGIFAQSVGGGGGNAGINIAKFRQTGDRAEDAKGFSFALGGGTGDGGTGANVSVTHTGDIATTGFNSYGILAQSVGGGGGNAAMDEMSMDGDGGLLSVVLGREGGTGGSAGDVTVEVAGNISTTGDMSSAIFAQSVGNGGGNSSTTKINLSVPLPESEEDDTGTDAATEDDDEEDADEDEGSSLDIAVAIGLGGGVGGAAGNVLVTSTGDIMTTGDMSHGIMAQSIGGGGGNAGSTEQHSGENYGISINLGGTGGSGGTGGDVTVSNAGVIRTSGKNAYGIFAQSIGGSGGTGGSIGEAPEEDDADDADDAADEEEEAETIENAGRTLAVNIGGSGGAGMASGDVSVTNIGTIVTAGDISHGIVAQSIGGGGGNSGAITQIIAAEEADIAGSMTISVGGDGGTGAISGDVTVANTGIISTIGDKSAGIFAQTIGGGGGNADKILVSNSVGKGLAINADLSFGGSGGTGAAAGDVTVTNGVDALIVTTGVDSHGIFAQSVGGGGGTGGTVESYAGTDISDLKPGAEDIATAIDDGSIKGLLPGMSIGLQLSMGGSGGTGGTGGDVSVANAGLINTSGQGAHGIFAQSIGGGGGAGGATVNSATPHDSEDGETLNGNSFSLGFGGTGGEGNSAGAVIVENTGSIVVRGDGSYGVFAQSVGGGGGAGGAASTTGDKLEAQITTTLTSVISNLNFGGTGGTGGNGGDVTVTHSGDITVFSDNAYGIVAQSIGGGGGAGGVTSNGLTFDVVSSALDSVMGGSTGVTGTAGDITVMSTGSIAMLGENSVGILRNSVSGGGGIAATDLSGTVEVAAVETETETEEAEGAEGARLTHSDAMANAASAAATSMNVTMGAKDAGSNIGSNITASHTGDVGTTAANAFGTLTQTIGGGGGMSFTSVKSDAIATLDVMAQLGATATSNSGGGDISSARTGNLVTDEIQSVGDLMQSVGGGGGVMSLVAPVGSGATFALGGSGAAQNDGGAISSTIVGTTVTKADLAMGLVVQSIGAGGGTALVSGMADVSASLGAQDGGSGDGGDVSADFTGDMITIGQFAHGVVVQSIGGGGGIVIANSDRETTSVDLNASNNGDGGDVSSTFIGDIVVSGDGATGLVVQSIGGGGGLVNDQMVGTAGGAGQGGKIDVDVTGNVVASGANASAVVLQSAGRLVAGHEGDDITASFSGLLRGGNGAADEVASLVIGGGAANTVSIGEQGFIYSLNGQALLGSTGDETFEIAGNMIGNVDLGTGVNTINLSQTGYINGQDEIYLGDDGLMVIAGRFEPGGTLVESGENGLSITGGVEQTTQQTGSVAFTNTGQYVIDVRFLRSGEAGNGQSDLLTVTGSAQAGGTVLPTLYQLDRALPLVIIDADGAVANNGAVVADTIFLDYEIALNGETGDGSTIDLTIDPTFAIDGMTRNQTSAGNYINGILNGDGSEELGNVFALLGNIEDRETAIAMMDKLHGEGYAANGVVSFTAGQSFRNLTQSQSTAGGSDHCGEKDCGWAFSNSAELFLPATFDTRTISSAYDTTALGWHRTIDAGYNVGVAYGAQSGTVASGNVYGSGFGGHNLALYGFGTVNGLDVSGTLHYGRATFTGVRNVGLSGVLPDGTTVDYGSGSSAHVLSQFGLNLTASKTVPIGETSGFYIRPSAGLDIVRFGSSGATEAGLGALSLGFADVGHTIVTGTLGLDVGIETQLTASSTLAAFAGVSRQFSNADSFIVDTQFAGAPLSAGSFENYAEFGDSGTMLSVGARVTNDNNGLFVDMGYQKRLGTDNHFQQMSVEVGMSF